MATRQQTRFLLATFAFALAGAASSSARADDAPPRLAARWTVRGTMDQTTREDQPMTETISVSFGRSFTESLSAEFNVGGGHQGDLSLNDFMVLGRYALVFGSSRVHALTLAAGPRMSFNPANRIDAIHGEIGYEYRPRAAGWTFLFAVGPDYIGYVANGNPGQSCGALCPAPPRQGSFVLHARIGVGASF